MTLPVLDMRDFRGSTRARFAAQLGDAFESFGFVCLRGHTIGAALIEPAYAAMRRFFALPEELKRRYIVPGSGGARGYTPFAVETAKDQALPDLKEFFHVGRELPPGHPHPQLLPNVWPDEVRELKPSTLALWSALECLGAELLEAVAMHLGLEPGWFADKVDHGNSILRPLHYPPLSVDAHGLRSAPHEDINLITLLVSSGEPGLQILRRRSDEAEGTWLAIAAEADQVVVNVGDMLQRLTNHVLVSTTHRVVNPPPPWSTQSRYSIPFFLHLNPEFTLRTLPSCITEARPERYPEPISAHAYLEQRLREINLL